MRSAVALALAGLSIAASSLSLASCRSEAAESAPAHSPAAAAATSSAPGSAAPRPASPAAAERSGVFAPASSVALSLWPEAYAGELLLVEVMPQGSAVKEGDVVARLDTRSIDEQLHQAELEAASAAVRHAGVVEKNKIDDEAAASALDLAKSALDRARRSLEGWKGKEIAFAKRGDDISKKNEDANIDDQKDELAQLEKMYKADELVDATEEIVLKRAQRRLAISEDSVGLSGDRRKYRVDYDEAMQTEVKQEAVRTQEQALDRLVRSLAIERRAREDGLLRSKDALDQQNQKLERLKRDREKFAIHAPRAGVLLHGKEKDYRPGRTPARFERGSALAARTDVFLVADPDTVAVTLDVPESMLKEAGEGASVVVQSVAMPGENGAGKLHVEAYPAAKPGEENGYDGTVTLDHPMPGVLFGMRAKVKLAGAPAAAAANPAKTGP
jgi:HlyD family secretion protein